MTASPPWASTTAAISGVSVATATLPIPAASARRRTWTIMGWPAMSNSGLPGKRTEDILAGISIKIRNLIIRDWSGTLEKQVGNNGDGPKARTVIRVARARANRYLIRASGAGAKGPIPDVFRGRFIRPNSTFPAWSLIRNGLLRTQQDHRRHPWHLPRFAGDELHSQRDFRPQQAAETGVRNRREGRGCGRREGSRRAGSRADRKAVADRLGPEGRSCGKEVRGVPHLRQGRQEWGRPKSLWDRRRQEGRGPRVQFFCSDEGEGRHLDHRRPQPVPPQPQRLYPWHGDGLRRHSEGYRTSGHPCLFELARRQAGTIADRGEVAAFSLRRLVATAGPTTRPFCFPAETGSRGISTSAARGRSQFRDRDLSPHKGCYDEQKAT